MVAQSAEIMTHRNDGEYEAEPPQPFTGLISSDIFSDLGTLFCLLNNTVQIFN